jgi:hypothetical protein
VQPALKRCTCLNCTFWKFKFKIQTLAGEPSDSGIFIVVSGRLGVFLDDGRGGPPVHANTLRYRRAVQARKSLRQPITM